ncbi:MAG: hypothetical protein SNJ59_12995 [Aggregatilineales bacterium]
MQASTYNGTVQFTCTNANATGTGSHVLDRNNTGAGEERLRIDITDGAGTLIYTLTYQNFLGTYSGGIGNFTYTTPPQYNPITFTVTSLAGNGLPEQVDFVAEGECAGLPTFELPSPPCVDIPTGSVVGRLTRTAQIFYAPAHLSPGLFLDGGLAFWVVGFDQTGEYAKIVLACQYVWVEADAIGPNFDAPWFGAPLPDRVVE